MRTLLLCVTLTLCAVGQASARPTLPPDTQPGAERLLLMCAVDDKGLSKLCRFEYPIADDAQRLKAGTELGWLDGHPFPIPGAAAGTEVEVFVRLNVKPAEEGGGFEVTAPPDAFRTPTGPEITAPDWEVSPHEKWADLFIPERAERMRQKGGASLRCVVTETGALLNCWVQHEMTPGFGFGEAILKLSPLVRMKAKDRSGQPVAGRPFVLTLVFPGENKTGNSNLDVGWSP